MSPLFGTTALDAKTSESRPGVTQCTFALSVGSQGKSVVVTTHNNYAQDSSYIFPSDGKTVPGIGTEAILSPPVGNAETITVKLGANALQIQADFYNQPIDENLLIQLAKEAVART